MCEGGQNGTKAHRIKKMEIFLQEIRKFYWIK